MGKWHSKKYVDHVVKKSPKWMFIRGITIALTFGRDVFFPLLKATHAHHLHYRSIGHEVPIIDVIPVSSFIHKILHLPFLWKNRSIRKLVNYIARFMFIFWYSLAYYFIQRSIHFS